MASSTRIQLTYEEIAVCIEALRNQQYPDIKLVKKLNKAIIGLQPSKVDFSGDYDGLNNFNPNAINTTINPNTKFTDDILNKVMNDEAITEEEREHFNKINGYYPC